MDRLKFFKSLGMLAGSFLIPTGKILAITDFVEKKSEPIPHKPNGGWENNMTIQRKTVSITGGIGNTPYDFTPLNHKVTDFKEYWDNEDYKYGIRFYVSSGKFHKPFYGKTI